MFERRRAVGRCKCDVAAYANSMSRATKGTTADWVLETVSVLVPANALWIGFGNVVDGAGDVWIDDVDVRVVDAPITVLLNDAGFESTERFAGQVSRDVFVTARAAHRLRALLLSVRRFCRDQLGQLRNIRNRAG